jgi:hypothetical protein
MELILLNWNTDCDFHILPGKQRAARPAARPVGR